jgi:uncharacterized protein (TIGR02391 family)
MNYRAIATLVGDTLKYEATINEIGRLATSLFDFSIQTFPNDSITSSRAKLVYDWILTLARQEMEPERRDLLLRQFCLGLANGSTSRAAVEQILFENGGSAVDAQRESLQALNGRALHREVLRHARDLFLQGNYFHAVFEASKAYNKDVREKARSTRDGQPLMLQVWDCGSGVLKITACTTETDRNVQDGIKFLSAGLMQAIRNPTAHEPAVDWPISRQDCLDILSFLSFLYRKLDDAVYYATPRTARSS